MSEVTNIACTKIQQLMTTQTNNHPFLRCSFVTTICFLGLLSFIGLNSFKGVIPNSPSVEQVYSKNSLPVPLSLFNELRQDFSQAYLSEANNRATEKNLKVKWQDLSTYIDVNYLRNRIDTGIAIHYLILKDSSDNPYFSYAISYARVDPVSGITLMPFNGTSQYIMITAYGMEMVSSSNMTQYKADYKDSIKVYRDYPTSVVYKIDTLNHPTLSYFDGGNFTRFYEDNMALATPDSLNLNFFNGAILNDSIRGSLSSIPLVMKVQTPVMAFGDSSSVFILNGTLNYSQPYLNRALDFGGLCPPSCK